MKYIWIDIGTHFAQEYNSIFGSNIKFLIKISKNIFDNYLFNKRIPKIDDIFDLIKNRIELKKKKDKFYFVFVEANPRIFFFKKKYQEADIAFNIAITDNFKYSKFPKKKTKLYILGNDFFSQGNSIYSKTKRSNFDKNKFIWTKGISANNFFLSLKKRLDRNFNKYKIILRLNCEGAEDTIVYETHKIFKNNLSILSGSFQDVKNIKGRKAYKTFQKFLKEKKIKTYLFTSKVDSWNKIFKKINRTVK